MERARMQGSDPEEPLFTLEPAAPGRRLVPQGLRSDAFPRVEFYADRCVLFDVDAVVHEPRRIELRPEAIGLVQFERPRRVSIGWGFARGPERRSIDIHCGRLIAEDRFDQVVAWLEDAAPEHAFSIIDGSELQQSRPFALADCLPFRARTSEVRIERHASGYAVGMDRCSCEVRVHGQAATLAESAASEPAVLLAESRFLGADGRVLGWIEDFGRDVYGIEVPGGPTWFVNDVRRLVARGHEVVGRFDVGGQAGGQAGEQEASFVFTEPVDEPAAVLLVLAVLQREAGVPAAPARLTGDPEPVWVSRSRFRWWVLLSFVPVLVLLGWIFARGSDWAPPTVLIAVGAFAFVAGRGDPRFRRTAITFCSDRIVARFALPRVQYRVFAAWSVGHLCRLRFGRMRIVFADDDREDGAKLDLRVPVAAAMDEVLGQLERMCPSHVCSFVDAGGRVAYSRPWTLGELLPGQKVVDRAWLHPDHGEGTTARTEHGVFPVTRHRGHVLNARRAREVPVATVFDDAITFHNGMILAAVIDGLHARFGSGESIAIDPATGEVTRDGEPFGRLVNEDDALRIDLSRPGPEVLPILVLLLFAQGRRQRVGA